MASSEESLRNVIILLLFNEWSNIWIELEKKKTKIKKDKVEY